MLSKTFPILEDIAVGHFHSVIQIQERAEGIVYQLSIYIDMKFQ